MKKELMSGGMGVISYQSSIVSQRFKFRNPVSSIQHHLIMQHASRFTIYSSFPHQGEDVPQTVLDFFPIRFRDAGGFGEESQDLIHSAQLVSDGIEKQ